MPRFPVGMGTAKEMIEVLGLSFAEEAVRSVKRVISVRDTCRRHDVVA